MKTNQGHTKEFRITRGIRQSGVLSQLLYDIYTADLDEVMRKRGTGGIEIKKK